MKEPVDDLSTAFLAHECVRTMLDYSWAWEGEREEVIDLGGAIVHHLSVPWFDINGMVGHIHLDESRAERHLDAMIQTIDRLGTKYWWIVAPDTSPADLGTLLEKRGLKREIEWAGLALRDLNTQLPINPEIVVESLSAANAEEYTDCNLAEAETVRPGQREERLNAALRYAASPPDHTGIHLARLNGKVVSCVVSHIEATGVLYLRNAFTLKGYRHRGIYLTMVAHRLRLGREAGCRAAVVQAQTRSSAPILMRRGFERVSTIYAYTRSSEDTGVGETSSPVQAETPGDHQVRL